MEASSLLEAPAGFRRLLQASGSSWRLLEAPQGFRRLLEIPGGSNLVSQSVQIYQSGPRASRYFWGTSRGTSRGLQHRLRLRQLRRLRLHRLRQLHQRLRPVQGKSMHLQWWDGSHRSGMPYQRCGQVCCVRQWLHVGR